MSGVVPEFSYPLGSAGSHSNMHRQLGEKRARDFSFSKPRGAAMFEWVAGHWPFMPATKLDSNYKHGQW